MRGSGRFQFIVVALVAHTVGCGRLGFTGTDAGAGVGGLDGGLDAGRDAAGLVDTGVLESGVVDAGVVDAGDAGVVDVDAGPLCSGDSWPEAWERPAGVDVNFRSIGRRGDPVVYATGVVQVAGGSNCLVFDGGTLPFNVGTGDRIRLSVGTPAEEEAFVLLRIDDRQLLVQQAVSEPHNSARFEILRAYPSLQAWEDDRSGDLVAEGRRELGVCYDDAPFDSAVLIIGSNTDATYYMHLTVAPLARHSGLAGSGVVLEPVSGGHAIIIFDDHTRVDSLEITRWSVGAASSYDGINIRAQQVVVDSVLIHHDGAEIGSNPDCNGITVERDGASATVRNSIVYHIARTGISIHQVSGASLVIENCTLYSCAINDTLASSYGCIGGGGRFTARNVISTGSAASDFYGGTYVDSHHNISSDSTAPGLDPLLDELPANHFVSLVPGAEDLHLLPTAPALGIGVDLSGSFTTDIDGDTRPTGAPWDIGADERP